MHMPGIWLVALIAAVALPVASEELFDPVTGYRLGQYRAPVPEVAPGAVTVDVEAVARLRAQGGILLDVRPGARLEPLVGGWIAAEPLLTIEGAHWLPEVGRGRIEDQIEAYLVDTLDRLTGGAPESVLIVFCRVDCWMSWNAAQRIAGHGYTAVHWFPNGIEAWEAAGLPTATIRPEPIELAE